MKKYRNPIIVLGMHRSGTSLVSQLLTELGVFMGADLSHLYEPHFFVNSNRWLLEQAGAAWNQPEPFAKLMQKTGTRQVLAEYLQFVLNSPRILQFLGFRRALQYRSLFRITEIWGWKDPRNVYTLPVWLELFPDAKFVVVNRNGIDVAASLAQRSLQTDETFQKKWKKPLNRVIYSVSWKSYPKMINQHLSLQEAFSLWELYTGHLDSLVKDLKPENVFTLRYENLLLDGKTHLSNMADFIGTNATAQDIERAQSLLKSTRAYAFQEKANLLEFYQQVKTSPQMQRLGYGNL